MCWELQGRTPKETEESYRWVSAVLASGNEQDGGRLERKIYWPMKEVNIFMKNS